MWSATSMCYSDRAIFNVRFAGRSTRGSAGISSVSRQLFIREKNVLNINNCRKEFQTHFIYSYNERSLS